MAEIKIKADSNGGTVSLKGPASTTGDAAIQLTLPVDDGSADQYLKTDGSGALSWATVSSIGGDTGTTFNDDVKVKFGTGNDLEIFHDPDGGDSSAAITKIMANNGDLRIGTQLNKRVILGAYYDAAGGGDTLEIWGGSNIVPAANDTMDCGETNHKWDDIYATNGTIQTSDRNDKDNITTSDLGLSFINKLSPKSYKFKGKTRTHYGLVSQDVETVLGDISKPTSGFAGFIKTDSSEAKDGSSYNYGLRYNEFIGPLVKAVQELSAEVETLKTKVAALEAG